MAAASPIVVDSSSPTSHRPVTLTPPSAQRKSKVLVSSSPGLLSPSAFVRPRHVGVTSGSRAQHLPGGIQPRFASAGSLWKLSELGLEEERSGRSLAQSNAADKCAEKNERDTGRLVKPKKASSQEQHKDSIPTKKKELLDEYAYPGPDQPKPQAVSKKAASKPERKTNGNLKATRVPAPSRAIDRAEYASKPKDDPEKAERAQQKLKKPRKAPGKPKDASTAGPVKKPRKRKKKSESIVLNSDEPESGSETATASGYFARGQNQERATDRDNGKYSTDTSTLDAPKNGGITIGLSDQRFDGGRLESVVWPYGNVEQSAYFTNAVSKDTLEQGIISHKNRQAQQSAISLEKDAQGAGCIVPLPSRRRDWTPVKDSPHADSGEERPPTAQSAASDEPIRQLGDILGGFGYVSGETESRTIERTATGEAATKRRRIELDAPAAINTTTTSEIPAQVSIVAKPAKQKKPRKKAQTITALATAAFRLPREAQTDDGTISHFFSPSKDIEGNFNLVVDQVEPKTNKPRKPRKRKEKVSIEGEDASTKGPKPSKAKKARPNVNFDQADYKSKLYSPNRATARLKSQDLLFGTSSQLAVDESASFIRDTQVALGLSELPREVNSGAAPASSPVTFSQAQKSPQGKSCVRVPTAPHGTCLSIEQARRELWCVPSRNADGNILIPEEAVIAKLNYAAITESDHHTLLDADVDAACQHDAIDAVVDEVNAEHEDVVVDLRNTPPTDVRQCGDPVPEVRKQPTLQECTKGNDDLLVAPATEVTANVEDRWMLLESSSPLIAAQNFNAAQVPALEDLGPGSRSATLLSPPRFRPPLSTLNPNTTSLTAQSRHFNSKVADQAGKSGSPSERGRGRPRKGPGFVSPSQPKGRGRPPKLNSLASEPAELPKPKKLRTNVSASQPTEAVGWIDIDDIYDSDSPATPSPPRRRATPSPPAVQPLAFSRSISANLGMVAISSVAALKSTDAHWAAIRSDLFSRITAIVKSAPHSTDPRKPSWYEKISLYDPIVLEDITSWLHEQGLKVAVTRPKLQPKKKGRKRKEAERDMLEVEWEIHEEPLQAWMVQKWAEEKSICCLWKGGLRGGVREGY